MGYLAAASLERVRALEDLEQLYTVLWFDPGGTTGWALISVYPEVIGPVPFERWYTANVCWDDFGAPSMTEVEGRLAWDAERASAAEYHILDNIVFWSAGEIVGPENSQVDAMIDLVEAWPGTAPIGCEDFTLRQFRQDDALLAPVRITAKFDYALRDTGAGAARGEGEGRRMILQQPALAMTFLPDERLRLLADGQFYTATRGRPHARDALRHALTFLRREKEARSKGKTLEIPIHIIRPAADPIGTG